MKGILVKVIKIEKNNHALFNYAIIIYIYEFNK